jgi:hypothetical protein
MDKILDLSYLVDKQMNLCQVAILDEVHNFADEYSISHDKRISLVNKAVMLYTAKLKQPAIINVNRDNARLACIDAYQHYIDAGKIYDMNDDDIHRIHALFGYITELEHEISLFE